ncbi:MAG: hypothetical protein M1825_005010 [Sarcosagium campestre]|nr:MAG: hypothetical protein M1825_005010 [Sarcosagium campestre]
MVPSNQRISTSSTESNSLPIRSESCRTVASSQVASEDVENATKTESTGNELSRSRSTIPRSARRGLFGSLTVVPEVVEPVEYERNVKWFLTFVVAAAAAAAPMGSAIFFPALPELSTDLNTTPTITNLSVAFYMLSMAIFPLWWSAFSEIFGRRSIYLVSFAFFVLFNILCAVSNSITMLIIMRILVGGSAASVQAVGAGTIADIWEPKERGQAMGIFYLGPLCGPLLAPIIGGALAEKWGWRATMWFLVIWGGVLLVLILFCLPETLKADVNESKRSSVSSEEVVSSDRPSTSERSRTGASVRHLLRRGALLVKRFLFDPLKIILFLRYPAVLITVYYASITFGTLYILNLSIQYTFSKPPYSYSTLIIGLLYIPNSLGYFLASYLGGRWSDWIMMREARSAGRFDENGKPILRPEDRMRENAYIAAVLYPAALIWYGWTAEKGIFWLVPMIANFFFGVGSMLVFAMATTMLTEFMPKKSSSGVALNNFVRNIFSAVGGIVTQPLLSTIGNGWLFSALGVIAMASVMVVWAMRKYGAKWRAEMDHHLSR